MAVLVTLGDLLVDFFVGEAVVEERMDLVARLVCLGASCEREVVRCDGGLPAVELALSELGVRWLQRLLVLQVLQMWSLVR